MCACQRGWVSQATARERVEYARMILKKYPRPEDWDRVRFSDEAHFGLGPQGKLRVNQKPGQRFCSQCIQYKDEPKEEYRKKFHRWAAVGYNIKSDIHFNEVPGNTNGKMSQRVYIDQILGPIVKPWLKAGQDFVLEEDNDSGHGTGKRKGNTIRAWMQEHGLESF